MMALRRRGNVSIVELLVLLRVQRGKGSWGGRRSSLCYLTSSGA